MNQAPGWVGSSAVFVGSESARLPVPTIHWTISYAVLASLSPNVIGREKAVEYLLGIMSASEETAQHILDIYRLRLKMAEDGVTHPKPKVVAGMRQLVAGLSALPSGAIIRGEVQADTTRFIVASTGELLVEFDFKDDAS